MTKRALMREFLVVQWNVQGGTVTWPQFLAMSIQDRMLMFTECDGLIAAHNEQTRTKDDDEDD